MIRGKKNFLPPAQLILGFGVMWQISEDSQTRHVKHRFQDVDMPVKSKQEELEALDEKEADDESVKEEKADEGAENERHGAHKNNGCLTVRIPTFRFGYPCLIPILN